MPPVVAIGACYNLQGELHHKAGIFYMYDDIPSRGTKSRPMFLYELKFYANALQMIQIDRNWTFA